MKTVKLPDPIEMPGHHADYMVDNVVGKGWQSLAKSTFAAIYSHPKKPGRVLKVARGDTAYDGFLSVVLAHPGNPFFPKIYSVKRYRFPEDNGESLTVVEMERLTPFSEKLRNRKQIHNWRESMEIAGDGWTPLARWWDEQGEYHSVPRAWRNKWELQAAKILQYLFERYRSDLHSGNIMLRGRHPVITDPVF